MKKLGMALVVVCLLMSGCADTSNSVKNAESEIDYDNYTDSQTENEDNQSLESDTIESEAPEYIDGFEVAKYDKFNSYASENGLGDTLIVIEGNIVSQIALKTEDQNLPELALVIEQDDGNRWLVSLISDKKINGIEGEKARIFGMYLGFSDVMNLPAMGVTVLDVTNMEKARIEIDKDGEWVEVWNYYDDFAKEEIDKLLTSNGDGEKESSIQEGNKNETEGVEETEISQDITVGMKNALQSAKQYLSFSAFSRDGLINQLLYEKYTEDESKYAADNCGANWNEQALKSAKNYLNFSAYSYTGLIGQLEYEKFTHEQAVYGADNCGADWNEQAAKSAENYLEFSSYSRDGLIEQLEYEGFTYDQAVYGVEQNGL